MDKELLIQQILSNIKMLKNEKQKLQKLIRKSTREVWLMSNPNYYIEYNKQLQRKNKLKKIIHNLK
jgi:hypothetical protein